MKKQKKITESERKQVMDRIHKKRRKYYTLFKINAFVWILLAILSIINVWFFLPWIISGIALIIFVKKFCGAGDEQIKLIYTLYKRTEIYWFFLKAA